MMKKQKQTVQRRKVITKYIDNRQFNLQTKYKYSLHSITK